MCIFILECTTPTRPIVTQSKGLVQLTKEERINGYARYEWEITHDPLSKTIPIDRFIHTKEILENRFNTRVRNSDDWTSVGPADVGGRTRAILVDANDDTGNTVYAGSVSGGLYKSTTFKSDKEDWKPVSTIDENLAIGALLQDPNDSDIMYAGTGEGWFNGDASLGEGIYKTTDGRGKLGPIA